MLSWYPSNPCLVGVMFRETIGGIHQFPGLFFETIPFVDVSFVNPKQLAGLLCSFEHGQRWGSTKRQSPVDLNSQTFDLACFLFH